MVATYFDQPITKSYVRLPGSGSDRRAGVSYCDLSRGSSLAASISVPQSSAMPKHMTSKPATPITKYQPVAKSRYSTNSSTSIVSVPGPANMAGSLPAQTAASTFVPQTATGTVTSINNKRPRNNDDSVDANISTKRICFERANQNVPLPSSNNILRPEAVTVTIPAHTNGTNFIPTANAPVSSTQNANTLIIVDNTAQEATQLREENTKLQSENAVLKKQLSLFKQLMANPQRLQSVLQTLNKRVC